MLQNPLMTAALAFATTAFTVVGVASFAFMAIMAVRMFWRVLLAILGVALYLAYPDVRALLNIAGLIALLGWGWERWNRFVSEGGLARTKNPMAQDA